MHTSAYTAEYSVRVLVSLKQAINQLLKFRRRLLTATLALHILVLAELLLSIPVLSLALWLLLWKWLYAVMLAFLSAFSTR
jgi:hypothetical protein